MARFKFVKDAGYLYNGEAGNVGVACPGCDTTFEGPTDAIARSGAQACLDNHQRGNDYYDSMTLEATS